MNLFVYSDESGVLDKAHNKIYVFGGLIFLKKEIRDIENRKYIHVEKMIRANVSYSEEQELKACKIKNQDKYKLYRSLGSCIKFGAIIEQENILNRIFNSKKDKQRYLDYVYKIALKRAFLDLIQEEKIKANLVENIYIFADEHTTATNGCYELREGLEQEFKFGTYNYSYDRFFPPVFNNLKSVNLNFCNSASTPLIRAADIIANKIYHDAINRHPVSSNNLYLTYFP